MTVAARFQATTSQVAVLISGGAGIQSLEHPLQPRRDALLLPIARFRRAAKADEEEVLAFDVGQHQGAGDPVEHVGRGRAAPALFEPGVPGRADVGPLGHLLASEGPASAGGRPGKPNDAGSNFMRRSLR